MGQFFILVLPEKRGLLSITSELLEAQEGLDVNQYVKTLIDGINSIVTYFDYEEIDYRYDSKNIRNFLQLSQDTRSYPKIGSRLRSVFFQQGFYDWRECGHCSHRDVFSFFGVPPPMVNAFCEAAKVTNSTMPVLVLNNGCTRIVSDSIPVLCNGDVVRVAMRPISIRPIHFWFSDHRTPRRVFRWNPKHGENGTGAYPSSNNEPVSVLLCSKEEAAKMLQSAIGVRGESRYFYYDAQRSKYIVFYPDNAGGFHSFHLQGNEMIPPSVDKKMSALFDDAY